MRMFFLLLIIAVASSCSDGNSSQEIEILTQVPYAKLTDSIQHSPNNAGLYYRRGSLLYNNEEMALAEYDLRKAWELQPGEEHALGVSTLLKQKNQDEAIQFLEQALKRLPNSLILQLQLAQGYKWKGQLNRSLEICEQIISRYPNNIDVLLLKAEILKSQNKMADALTTLEQAYQLAPGDVELVHTLAFDYAESKNPKVLSLSDSLIKADTEKSHAEPYYFKGVYFSNTGNYAEAVKQFDKAIQMNYTFINAYINKGIVYYDQKKYKEAFDVFTLAAKVFPDEADPYYWLARTQEVLGKREEARLNYQLAYKLDTTLIEAKEAAGRLK